MSAHCVPVCSYAGDPYLMKTHHTPESKMLVVEENMARALSIKWSDFALAKAVSW